MKCIFCDSLKTRVIDKRMTSDSSMNRRRRECLKCKKRFTTYEKTEGSNIIVLKKDSSKETFSSKKIRDGILRACEKRPISEEKIDKLTKKILKKIKNYKSNSITSKKIGELVMKELKKLDEISYVRFASVYKAFENKKDFEKELKELK